MEKSATKKPFLKWAGSKTKLISALRPYLPQGNHRYVEPFVGSGAVFLNTNYSKNVLCDSNADLISLYGFLKTRKLDFIRGCKELFSDENNTEDKYYAFREEFNKSKPSERRAALFVYLNRHCYNGLCRYNSSGQFNTPFGKYDGPYFPEIEMLDFADRLINVELKLQDFRQTFADVIKGDVVYCDPPYVPLNDTANFTSYSTGGFSMADQKELAELLGAATRKGAIVLVSNHDTPITRKLYDKAVHTEAVLVRRMISCNGENRTKTKELIAVFSSGQIIRPQEEWFSP